MLGRCLQIILCSIFAIHITARLSAQPQVDSLESILRLEDNSTNLKAHAAIELSRYYLTKDLEKTKKHAVQSLIYAQDIDSLFIQSVDQIAKYHFFNSQFDSALHYFQTGAAIADKSGDQKLSATIGISIGSTYLQLENYEDAINTLIQCVEYFEKDHDTVNAAKCYSNIASAHAQLGNYSQAIQYSNEALAVFKPKKLHQYTLLTLPNLATHYMKIGDTIRAKQLFAEAESLALEQNDLRSLALIYNNLGDLHLSQQMVNSAKKYFEKSIELKKQLNQLQGIESTYHNLGYTYALEGNHSKALEFYQRSLFTSSNKDKVIIFNKMKESYKAMHDYQQALNYSELAQELSDSFRHSFDLATFAEINARYETTRKENEILRLESEKQKLEINKNRNKYLLLSIVGLLLAISIVGLQHIANQKRKQIISQQKHDLEQQKMVEQLRMQEEETLDLIVKGQEEERDRIAADLHDSLGSKMATLKLYMDNIAEIVKDGQEQSIDKAKNLTDLAYGEIRNLSHTLRSGVLIGQGLMPALKNFAAFISSSNQIKVEFIEIDLNNRLENSLEIQLFRIIQELITNVIKHAKAQTIIVQLTEHVDTINIMIEDDGQGFDVQRISDGMGLKNLEKRIDCLGATFEIDSTQGVGTTVMINIPV